MIPDYYLLATICLGLVHESLNLDLDCRRFSPIVRDADAWDSIVSGYPSQYRSHNGSWHATKRHRIDNPRRSSFDEIDALSHAQDRLAFK